MNGIVIPPPSRIPNRTPRRAIAKLLIAACVVATVGSSAFAQGRRVGQQAGSDAGGAVGNAVTGIVTDAMVGCAIGPILLAGQVAEVFEEIGKSILNLPQAQYERIQEINAEVAAKVAPLKDLPPKERRAKLFAMLPQLQADYIAKVNEQLDAEQRVTFRKLVLELRGPAALLDADVATALELSESQRKKVTETGDHYDKLLKELTVVEGEPGPFQIAALLALRKRRDAALLAVVTPEQRAAWKKMLGTSQLDFNKLMDRLMQVHLGPLLPKTKAERKAAAAQSPSTPAAQAPAAPPAPAAPSATRPAKPR